MDRWYKWITGPATNGDFLWALMIVLAMVCVMILSYGGHH